MTRKLKIQSQYRRLRYSFKTVPELKLSGVWLEKLGFKRGGQVNITAKEQEIIIRLSK